MYVDYSVSCNHFTIATQWGSSTQTTLNNDHLVSVLMVVAREGTKCKLKYIVFMNNILIIRHEKPTDPDDPLADQNIKDRFYGTNDPVAEKLMKRYTAMPKLEPPEDKTITTLYVGNLGEKITESDLKSVAPNNFKNDISSLLLAKLFLH